MVVAILSYPPFCADSVLVFLIMIDQNPSEFQEKDAVSRISLIAFCPMSDRSSETCNIFLAQTRSCALQSTLYSKLLERPHDPFHGRALDVFIYLTSFPFYTTKINMRIEIRKYMKSKQKSKTQYRATFVRSDKKR